MRVIGRGAGRVSDPGLILAPERASVGRGQEIAS